MSTPPLASEAPPPLPDDPRVHAFAERLRSFIADGLVAGGAGSVDVSGTRTLLLHLGCAPRLARPLLIATLDVPWRDSVDVALPLVPQREWLPTSHSELAARLAANNALAALRIATLDGEAWVMAHATAPRSAWEDAALGPRMINALVAGDSLALARAKRVPCTCPASAADATWLRAHSIAQHH